MQIEFRNATVRLVDGHSNTGAVNHGGGYAAGATTMAIDTLGTSEALPLLSSFNMAGHGTTYIVTARSGGPPTTSITFTPGLEALVADDAVITFGGRTLEVHTGQGNVAFNEQRKMDYTLDRGILDTVREGDDVPMDVTLDFIWDFITAASGDNPTVEDVLKQRGEASAWESSSSDPCEPYAIDIQIQHIPPCISSQQVETITLPDFRYEGLNHNLRDAQVAVTGKCNAKQAIVSRADA